MVRILQRIFRVYPNEVRLLLWVSAMQLAMRISSVLINNYAQAAFLKRFGVEYLPTIFVVEAILTFFMASAVGLLMGRFRTIRVFTGLLLFFALAVATIRGLLPLNIAILYPILFILKSQAIETLPILYWDILNDLFTTRQSKRLFTLITAGGILGTTLGSIMTGTVARWVGIDNVLLIFVGGTLLAALLNENTERVVGTPLETSPERRRRAKRMRLRDTVREAYEYSKVSPFLKYMIVLVAVPNIVLPVLTYQFNVVVDMTYATERDTLQFLGIFRGISNAVIFVILLFSGRLVNKWGVATSLLLHPVNYVIGFLALFFRFDIFSAVYARFTTETLKTTINNPARSVLYNFFPTRMRGLVRVFLRGTVVRASQLAGSSFLMVVRSLMEPRVLSLVAAPLVGIWIVTSFAVKRKYPSLLVQVLMDKQIDWRRLEAVNLRELAQDRKTLETLRQGLRDESHDIALLCGQILSQASPPGWGRWIVEALHGKPPEVQRALMDLLDPAQADELVPRLVTMGRDASGETLVELLRAISRLDPRKGLLLAQELVDHPEGRVRASALAALYSSGDRRGQEICRMRVSELISDAKEDRIREGLEVLSDIGDPGFSEVLVKWAQGQDPQFKALALRGLSRLRIPEALSSAIASVGHPSSSVRKAAAEVMIAFANDVPLQLWVRLLGDEDPEVRRMASDAIRGRGDGVAQQLIPELASPSQAVRNEILVILEELESRPLDFSQFIKGELQKAYVNIAHAVALQRVDGGRVIPLLRDHLLETNMVIQETVLRVLAFRDLGDKAEVILRALDTEDKKDVDNAIEALESSLHSRIGKVLIPLLEDMPLEEKIAIGRKRMGIPWDGTQEIQTTLRELLGSQDPVTLCLVLYALADGISGIPVEEGLLADLDLRDPLVREASDWLAATRGWRGHSMEGLGNEASLVEKLLHVRGIPMFARLRVRELVAVAHIASERRCQKGEVVVREGEEGDVLYLVMKGEMSVLKAVAPGREATLAKIGASDFFGEMALFDREPRSASVRADTEAHLLKIEAGAFTRIMELYPPIPMNICRVFSQRTRALHEKIQSSRFGVERAKL
jgi:CRP-like cAMP-binding protein/HEAT repeat protein